MNEEKASQTNELSKDDKLNDEKYLRYYSFLLDGFHSCSMEIDKNLTNISVLGIAAMLLVQLPNIQHFWQLIILFLSIVSFLTTIICVLINYKNGKILGKGNLESGDPYKVEAFCNDCNHEWRLKGITQISEVSQHIA